MPRLLDRFAAILPSFEVAPKAHTRYEALMAAREAERTAAKQKAVRIASAQELLATFKYATRDPAKTFQLSSSGISISLDHRWFVAGMTGTGKTTLARELMRVYRQLYPLASVYILDSKADSYFDRDEGLYEGDDPPPVLEPGDQIIWRPGEDDIEKYSAWFDSILHARRPAVVYVDELSSLSRGPQSHAAGYAKLLKLGRSLHMCVITLSQEAAGIPRQTRNQVHHLVRMRLLDEIDSARMDRMLAGSAKPPRVPARSHGFWYRRLDRPGEPREFADWKELLS
jgi:energy-coupling factor transporter ATP-binding protein EcfA2